MPLLLKETSNAARKQGGLKYGERLFSICFDLETQRKDVPMRAGALLAGAGAVLAALSLSSCGQVAPAPQSEAVAPSTSLVVGSQAYYSNQIVAEIYAQALEGAGYQVQRDFKLEDRKAYLDEIENAKIDVIPDYTGPLLTTWAPGSDARDSTAVFQIVLENAPAGISVLEQSPAADQDCFVTTKDFAKQWGISSIGDLGKIEGKVQLGASPAEKDSPHGPAALLQAYQIDVDFVPLEDQGGSPTLRALERGTVQVASLSSADPAIARDDLVVLDDPQAVFVSSQIVPLATAGIDPGAVHVINTVNSKLTTEDLRQLNASRIDDNRPIRDIALDWLVEKNLK